MVRGMDCQMGDLAIGAILTGFVTTGKSCFYSYVLYL